MAEDKASNTSELERELEVEHRRGYEKFLRVTAIHIVLIVIVLLGMALFLL